MRAALVLLGLGFLAIVVLAVLAVEPGPGSEPAPRSETAAPASEAAHAEPARPGGPPPETWTPVPRAPSPVSVALVTPELGPVGQWVYVHGAGFVPGSTTVQLGGAAPVSAAVYGPDQLAFTVPEGVTGRVGLTVRIPGASASSAPDAYRVGIPETPPRITAVSPASGPPGTWVYLSGEAFVFGDTRILVGEREAEGGVYSPGSLGLSVPKAPPGRYRISVTTPNGSATFDGSFEITRR